MESRRIVGTLTAFFETGTEGIFWAFLDNSLDGYDALNIVADGDYLFVEDGNGRIEWEGEVKLEYSSHKEKNQFYPAIHQRLRNCTVHGIPVNVDPELWFEWFTTDRPAVLIKGVK
jgi:hypothetical protein